MAKYWFERLARIPVEIDVASEFRYREAPMSEGGLALFISQSGETADTLASLRYAKAERQHIVSIVNVPTSSIARESDVVLPTLGGPEIGVASTKAFTCQLAVLLSLAIAAGRARDVLSAEEEQRLATALIGVPGLMSRLCAASTTSSTCRAIVEGDGRALFGARVELSALKLKEILHPPKPRRRRAAARASPDRQDHHR